jgi:4-hydroxy-tetrahydrodipicolinate reductase
MTYKVIQWATGVVAAEAVAGIVGHPDLELVGAWVHSADKDGRDVGELCGMETLGVLATRDKDALLAMSADCVCFMPGRTWVSDPTATFTDLLQILRSGKNVANLWWPMLVYPHGMGERYEQLQQACVDGGTSFCTVGMDPGLGTAGLGLAALPLARRVDSIRMTQIMDNSKWEGPGITAFFGFGQRDDQNSPILRRGVTTNYHGTTVQLMADAMGLAIDEIVEDHSVIYADAAFDIASGHIPADTISGVRYQVKGMVDGKAKIIVEHVEKLREEDFPELDFRGDGYRVDVVGEPCIRLDLTVSKLPSFTGDPIAVACAMVVVNSIPQVCKADPGVLSMIDLRPFPSRQ